MSININGETYLNTSEAMGKLGVSRPTFDSLVKNGQLKRYQQGIRKIAYYKLSELEGLLEMREEKGE
jgi:predicted DNA-binding transcriptional regulator AlpA